MSFLRKGSFLPPLLRICCDGDLVSFSFFRVSSLSAYTPPLVTFPAGLRVPFLIKGRYSTSLWCDGFQCLPIVGQQLGPDSPPPLYSPSSTNIPPTIPFLYGGLHNFAAILSPCQPVSISLAFLWSPPRKLVGSLFKVSPKPV